MKAKSKETNQINVEMLHDKILVKKIDVELKSSGGIIMGEIEKERETAFGKVFAVGEGKQVDGTGRIPMKTQVGDIITFKENIPRRVSYKGEHFYILRESDADFILKDTDIIEKEYVLEGYEYDKGISKMG